MDDFWGNNEKGEGVEDDGGGAHPAGDGPLPSVEESRAETEDYEVAGAIEALYSDGDMEPAAEPPPLSADANRPRWLEFIAVVAIIWAVEVFLGVIVAVVTFAAHGLPEGTSTFVPAPWAIVLTVPISFLVTTGTCWYFAAKRYGRTFADGLYFVPVSAGALRKAAAMGLAWAGMGAVVVFFLSTGESPLAELVVRPDPDDPSRLTMFYPILLVFVLVPVLEELYYRGFIYSVLARVLSVRWAFAITVLWFTLVHVPQLKDDPVGIPVILVMGVLCTWLRIRYESVYPAIVCHFVYNLVLVVLSVIQVTLHNHGYAAL